MAKQKETHKNIANLAVFGIGGTGSKLIEAVINLASSGNIPANNIIPFLIDQDQNNGNKTRCANIISTYLGVKKELGDNKDIKLFMSNIETSTNNRDPVSIVPFPVEHNPQYVTAFEYSKMQSEYQLVINSLYNTVQLQDTIDEGYKKRAYMGCTIIQKMLSNLDTTQIDYDWGSFKTRCKTGEIGKIVICGSLFGGMGASGMVNIGNFLLKEGIEKSRIHAVMMLPYFKVSTDSDKEENKKLINSDNDMMNMAIVLKMYNDRLRDTFSTVNFIGTTNPQDLVSKYSNPGGSKQQNPAHIFELLGAICVGKTDFHNIEGRCQYYYYTINGASADLRIPKFEIWNIDISFNSQALPMCNLTHQEEQRFNEVCQNRLQAMRDFAFVLKESESLKEWKGHQSWYLTEEEKMKPLLDWAKFHNEWWHQMTNKVIDDRRWEQFYYTDATAIKSNQDKVLTQLSLKLSKKLKSPVSRSTSDIIYALDSMSYLYQ